MITWRPIEEKDDAALAALIRSCLEEAGIAIPGTVYFDPELDHLSTFYNARPDKRFYYVLTDEDGRLVGGVGTAEYQEEKGVAELQKIYLTKELRGQGLGSLMMDRIEEKARELGYRAMYLETHSALAAAIRLYEKRGYRRVEPETMNHGAMDHFYLLDL